MGSVVSIEVAPQEAIGANLPKYFAKKGVSSKVIISRRILDNKAITPSTFPLIWLTENWFKLDCILNKQ